MVQKYEASNSFFRRESKKWTGWRAKNDEAKTELQKAVMDKKRRQARKNLGTIQKDIEEASDKVAHSTKNDRDKNMKETPESVRIREDAAARCTQVSTRNVLKKQARKTKADHLVKCRLMPGRSLKAAFRVVYINVNFTEDTEEWQNKTAEAL